MKTIAFLERHVMMLIPSCLVSYIRSRIQDHITKELLERDREFPLHSKGKEKFLFNYGVFLLNKNIAQLRHYCGMTTQVGYSYFP